MLLFPIVGGLFPTMLKHKWKAKIWRLRLVTSQQSGFMATLFWGVHYGYTMVILWFILWLYYGYTMVMLWLYQGFTMVILWLYYGYTMVILGLCYGYTMLILWLYYGHTMVLLWLYYGYTIVKLWLYYGYTMVMNYGYPKLWEIIMIILCWLVVQFHHLEK